MPVANKQNRFQEFNGTVELHNGTHTRVKEIRRPEYPWRMFKTLDLTIRGNPRVLARKPNAGKRSTQPVPAIVSENMIAKYL